MNDRLPPHDSDAERGVLACQFIAPECIGLVIEKFGSGAEEMYYDLRHQVLQRTFIEMFQVQAPVDVITVRSRLKESGWLDKIGGDAYLSALPDATPSAANLNYYLEIVSEKRTLRKVISTCAEAISRAYDSPTSIADLIDTVERDVLQIRPNQTSSYRSIKDLTVEAIGELDKMFSSRGAISGISSGLVDLDKATDGLHEGEMICIAAYPSAGKTALAMNIAVHIASVVPVFVASCEMLPKKLVRRAVCADARVNSFDLRDGLANEADFQRLFVASNRIAKLSLHVENTNGFSIGELVAMARRMKQQHNIGLMVVDYLQLLSSHGCDSREQEVSSISKGIKSIAMQLGIPVLALSQLNDDGKLRESRAIGQDADSVWFLDIEGERVRHSQPVTLRIEKSRDGSAPERVGLMFMKQFTRFESVSRVNTVDYAERDM